MRVQPRPLIAVGVIAGYVVLLTIIWLISGVDYDEVGDSTGNVLRGIVLPVAVGATFLTVVTTYLGWWDRAIKEDLRAPRWMWVVPVLMFVPGLSFLLGGAGEADRSAGFLLALGVGCLLVGFSEELMIRGTGLVGLRGGFGETLSWFFSCLLFGLIHLPNAFFGQSLGLTVQQIGLAFLAGTVLYVTRRVAGTLVVCMLLHAWIDFTTFAFSEAAVDADSPFAALAITQWIAFILAIVGVTILLRRGGRASQHPEASLTTA